jgi:hypothetical protein
VQTPGVFIRVIASESLRGHPGHPTKENNMIADHYLWDLNVHPMIIIPVFMALWVAFVACLNIWDRIKEILK